MSKVNKMIRKSETDQIRIPIGFTSSRYNADTQNCDNENDEKPTSSSQYDNLYFISITKAIKEYLQEELRGEIMLPENDLIAKIEAARTLFSDERNRLIEMRLTIAQQAFKQ